MADNPTAISVALVDDDETVRSMIAALIEEAEGLHFAGAYTSCDDALERMLDDPPDVVLMDINMPGRSGIECVQ
ncbi:response regulator, partial [candidate division KSB1 bacterium]|nr:response regulator [candidate division KSB1 bacterium]